MYNVQMRLLIDPIAPVRAHKVCICVSTIDFLSVLDQHNECEQLMLQRHYYN